MRLMKHITEDFRLENRAKRLGVRQPSAAFSFADPTSELPITETSQDHRTKSATAGGLPHSKTLRAFLKLLNLRWQ